MVPMQSRLRSGVIKVCNLQPFDLLKGVILCAIDRSFPRFGKESRCDRSKCTCPEHVAWVIFCLNVFGDATAVHYGM